MTSIAEMIDTYIIVSTGDMTNTKFGFEVPASRETLTVYRDLVQLLSSLLLSTIE